MRLDSYLQQNGFCESRSLGKKLAEAGYVTLNGNVCKKASTEVGETDTVEIAENPLQRYVSRGGLKLEKALSDFGILPEGLVCADIGASTGGFTDCLLQNGAKFVYAVDSGSDQLHPSLRQNERVKCMENENARFLDETKIEPVGFAVMDVSFISQALLYPAVSRILVKGGKLVSLIKPQFEVGRENIGKNGIVHDEKARRAAVEHLAEEAEKHHLHLLKTSPSPFPGGDGNEEILALFERDFL